MIKIKMIRASKWAFFVGEPIRTFKEGDVVEFDDCLAKQLITKKYAEIYIEPNKKPISTNNDIDGIDFKNIKVENTAVNVKPQKKDKKHK